MTKGMLSNFWNILILCGKEMKTLKLFNLLIPRVCCNHKKPKQQIIF